MSTSFDNFQKRRLITSYFSVVLSITLVLFLLGLLGLIVINSKKIESHLKENIAVTIDLKDTAKDVDIKQLQKSLSLSEEVKSTNFVSKEAAAEEMKSEFGEDFLDVLGYNPLRNSIDVFYKSDFVTITKLEEIKTKIEAKSFVQEVNYDSDLISLMNENVKRISFWILLACGIFTFIAMLLINSSIRLAVYSKRFIIKTMQMVGATKRFIRKPFVWKSIRLGIIGAIIAVLGLIIIAFYLDKTIPEIGLLQDQITLIGLCAFVFVLGIVITWISTFFATQRFLNLKTDDLYY